MKVTIHPSQLQGRIQAPASKSSMQRACAAAFLKREFCSLFHPGHSNDDKAAINIIRSLGAKVEVHGNKLVTIEPGEATIADEINCGESGLSIRMFVPIAALSSQPVRITGEGSLLNRPMDFFDDVLPQLGVQVESNEGRLPITVQGPLTPKNIEVDGSLSSQFLTGLLFAYAAAGASGLSIKVKDLKSKPYIDLTLEVIGHFGLATIENHDYREFYFVPGTTTTGVHNYNVECDWSSAAFLLVAGAIAGPLTVRGLDLTSVQADKAIVDAMMAANANIAIDAKGITVHPGKMRAFEFDATDCPDLFPPLAALAAYCDGISKIRGVSRLEHKESNRALTLQDEFDKMGIRIDLEDDQMLIYGGDTIKGADIHSQHDHRIAMACAVAALKADSETTIEEAQAVKKSYPDFFTDLQSLGADVSLPFQHFNL